MSQDSSDTENTDSADSTETTASVDPLDRVAITTNTWREASAARSERRERDRAILAAFDAGRTGTEIAAASGLDLATVYQVHRRGDQLKSDDEIERRLTENRRRLTALSKELEE